jgi:zinc transport system substrate-binding protein
MRRLSLIVAVAVAVAALALSACGGGDDADDGAVQAVAAFYPLAEALRQVGGDRVEVTDLTPPGAEPHDLELTSRDVDAVLDADVVVLMGDGFQPAVEDVAEDIDDAVFVLDEVDVDDAPDDPHLWLDPVQYVAVVERVADALIAADPDGADEYRANADRYVAELEQLDRDFEAGLASCERREIVTAHAAFGWLAARSDLVQEPIAGVEPDREPDARRLGELADLVERDGVTTVFTETLVAPDVAEALAREAGVDTAVLDPIEGITDDGADYLSVMRDNLATLRAALGCG